MPTLNVPTLNEILGPKGKLSQVLPGYEPRASQLTMAEKVESALARGRALVVEAGTGTGKTLAYLLPAARSGLKVVISTATKNLQEQLAEKDVPLLQKLGVTARFAFLKGRQNYLCQLRHEQFQRNPTFLVREDGAQLEEIARWAEHTETGDRAELTSLPDTYATWRELTSTADSCTGQKCAHFDDCFVFKMRRRAAEADVVVVNHHLFFADLALRTSSAGDTGGAAVLPKYDAVIFDEAHAVEEVATEHFGSQLSSFRVSELARDTLRALQTKPDFGAARDLANRLRLEGKDFFEAVQHSRPADEKEKDGARWPLLAGALAPAEEERQALSELVRALGAELSRDKDDPELLLLERRCTGFSADLSSFAAELAPKSGRAASAGSGSPVVHWAELRAGHLFLHASPVEVASLLQDRLYDRIGPVVFTSATLAVGNSLEYFQRRLGLRDAEGPLFPVDDALLLSPFDYQTHAALYLPRTMPDPNDPGFAAAVADELRKLLPITGGRAFALFTSLRNMRAVHEMLEGELPWQVLLQGQKPKAQLLRDFRKKPSVLFASQSFWEGVDVQGDALSMVVIDKLPFASPREPLVAARIDRAKAAGEEPFFSYQVPQAALALKQGFGRLIRSAQDRGVVAVLDRRVTQKGYGRLFVESLPRCPVLRTPEEVDRFWQAVQ